MTPTGAGTWIEGLAAPRPDPAPDGAPPDDPTLACILEAATTVPDHGALRPWRFTVVRGEGKDRLADALEAGLRHQRGPDVPDAMVAKMRNKAYVAPCTVALIASPDPTSNVPVWEQVASASCTGYAIVLASCGLGFGAVWKSAGVLDTPPVRALFELTEDEQLLGWVNIGTPTSRPKRESSGRGDLRDLVRVLGGAPIGSVLGGS